MKRLALSLLFLFALSASAFAQMGVVSGGNNPCTTSCTLTNVTLSGTTTLPGSGNTIASDGSINALAYWLTAVSTPGAGKLGIYSLSGSGGAGVDGRNFAVASNGLLIGFGYANNTSPSDAAWDFGTVAGLSPCVYLSKPTSTDLARWCAQSGLMTLLGVGANQNIKIGYNTDDALSILSNGSVIIGNSNHNRNPTLTSNWGTSPTLSTNAVNNVGTITVGTTPAANAVLTFNNTGFSPAWLIAPVCTVMNQTTGSVLKNTTTTAAMTVVSGLNTGDSVTYQCFGEHS